LPGSARPGGQFQLGLERRQWRAQFVSGVSHKVSLPDQRVLQPVKHSVHCQREGCDLIASRRDVQSGGGVVLSDLSQSPAHPFHRVKRRAGEQPGGETRRRGSKRRGSQDGGPCPTLRDPGDIGAGSHQRDHRTAAIARRDGQQPRRLALDHRRQHKLPGRGSPQLTARQQRVSARSLRVVQHTATGCENLPELICTRELSVASTALVTTVLAATALAATALAVRDKRPGGSHLGRQRMRARLQGAVQGSIQRSAELPHERQPSDGHHRGGAESEEQR
jgi:hypothetical protein